MIGIFDNMSWDYCSKLDGDGSFNIAFDHYEIPQPAMEASCYSVTWPSGEFIKHKIFAFNCKRKNGEVENRPMFVAETLWQSLLIFCDFNCHVIRYELRGGHRIIISSGHHDSKSWEFRGSSWEQVTKKASLTLMPGYWTP